MSRHKIIQDIVRDGGGNISHCSCSKGAYHLTGGGGDPHLDKWTGNCLVLGTAILRPGLVEWRSGQDAEEKGESKMTLKGMATLLARAIT